LSDTRQQLRPAGNTDTAATEESPLRAELFSASQMAEHGRHLADALRISAKRYPEGLLRRLSQNAQVIGETCTLLSTALREGRQVTPSSECLLEHRHLIEEQI